MNIFENPFYILGVSPADNRRAIAAAADDKAFLLGDSKTVEEARSALLIPEKRLAAEMRWFPGCDGEQVSEIIKFLENLRAGTESDIEDLDEITDVIDGIDKLNLFIYIWEFTSIDDYDAAILEINNCFEEIYIEEVLDLINYDRDEAGFPEADEPELEQELNNYRADIVKAIDGKLSAVELYDYINIINNLAEEYSGGSSLILGDLLDNYELNTAPSLEEQKNLVLSEFEALKPLMIAMGIADESDLENFFENLSLKLKDWHNMAKPLALAADARGIKNRNFEQQITAILKAFGNCDLEFANIINKPSLSLKTKYNSINSAVKLTQILQEYLGSISQHVSDFANKHIEELEPLKNKLAAALKAQQAQIKQKEQEKAQQAKAKEHQENLNVISQLNKLKDAIISEINKFPADIDKLVLNFKAWRAFAEPLIFAAKAKGVENKILNDQGMEIIRAVGNIGVIILQKQQLINGEQAKYLLGLMYILKEYLADLPGSLSVSINGYIKTLQEMITAYEKLDLMPKHRKTSNSFIGKAVVIGVLILLICYAVYKDRNTQINYSIQTRSRASSSSSYSSSSSNTSRRTRRNELNARLKNLKPQLDRTKRELDNLERELETMQSNINGYKTNYELFHNESDRLNHNAEINRYNDKVSVYNSLLEQHKRDIANYNSLVNEYNSLR